MNKNSILRNTCALMAGAFVAIVLTFVCEAGVAKLYPPPPGLDPRNPEVQKRMMMEMPPAALALVAVSYLIGTLGGAAVAARLSGTSHSRQGWFVGGLMLVAAIMNLTQIPHPHWFWAASIAAIIIGGWLGALAGRPSVSEWEKV